MKKRTLKIIISIAIVIACLVSSKSINFAAIYEGVNENQLMEYQQKNIQSAYNASRFKEKYAKIYVSKTSQKVDIEYPSNYAGVYIDEYNNLHIAYTDEIKSLDERMSEYDVQYDKVNYSMIYLRKIYDIIVSKMDIFNISNAYIDEINNSVSIFVESKKENEILEYLKNNVKNFEEKSICFQNEISTITTEAGGTKIKSDGKFTLGYNAYCNSSKKYGFVTCGHGVNSVGDKVKKCNLFSTTIGKVKYRKYSGNIDACFVEYSNQKNKTTECEAGGKITGTYSSTQITTGMIVSKYGYKSGLQEGTVVSTSCSVIVDGIIFHDQVKLDIIQEKGDSGAPVVHNFIGPMLDGQIRPTTLLGIATFANDEFDTAFVSKACNINQTFNLATYIVA